MSRPRPRDCKSRCTVAAGWRAPRRRRGESSRAAATPRVPSPRASRDSASTVAGSLQCKSSMTRTHGRSAARRSISSTNSRSMRSRLAPNTSRWFSERSSSARTHAICASQVGAQARSAAITAGAVGAAAEIAQAADERQERLVRAVELVAGAAQHADVAGNHACQRHLDQRRLADAGFAQQKHRLAPAAARALQSGLDGSLAPRRGRPMPRVRGRPTAARAAGQAGPRGPTAVRKPAR